MSFLIRVILHVIANMVAVKVADFFVPGFSFSGNWQDLVLFGIVLGIVNSFIRPIIKFLAFPVIILTLGLFYIVINIALLFFVASLVPAVTISGFWAAFWAVMIISLVNNIILPSTHKNKME